MKNNDRDPLLYARHIVDQRLSKEILDEGRRWEVATAIVNHLDLSGLINQEW